MTKQDPNQDDRNLTFVDLPVGCFFVLKPDAETSGKLGEVYQKLEEWKDEGEFTKNARLVERGLSGCIKSDTLVVKVPIYISCRGKR